MLSTFRTHFLSCCLHGIACAAALSGGAATAQPQPVRWVDAHFHMLAETNAQVDALARQALELMDRENIRTLIVMCPPQSKDSIADADVIAPVLAKYGDRFAVMGGGSLLNPQLQRMAANANVSESGKAAFRVVAQRLVDAGVKGFGEIALHHLSLDASHPYESIAADHPVLLMLADMTADNNLVLDVHFDPVLQALSLPNTLQGFQNPAEFKPNLDAFERLLSHNPNARISWAHAGGLDHLGFFTPDLVRGMLTRHANLFLSIRPLGNTPGIMLPMGGEVNTEWVQLLQEFPDRFVFGSDSFLVADIGSGRAARLFSERSQRQRAGIRKVLQSLQPELRRKVAFINAQRMYGLPQTPPPASNAAGN
jgi:predicted TIM-barrel fold metal-dependent hydrolase